ncbi:MAG: hypothetical protein IPM69_01900 [Ignavibacteria bacterium]|nr:hypothetical protein [Ignavibacteria bacterium]
MPFFIATLVATWYGIILGIGEFVYSQGIVAWVCMGLPFYGAAILFSIFIAGKVRNSKIISIPDMFNQRFGQFSAQIASILVLIISIPAAYILMLGVLIQMILGIDLNYSIIIGAILSISSLFTGGFDADVKTNTIQFVLMYVGFGALLVFCLIKYGSPTDMISILPPSHTLLLGNNSWQVVCTWFIIALQTFIDPSFHQRSAAATTPSVAKKGILISVGFWILFDFLTITTGLYARAYINTEAIMSFPALGAEVLPEVWRGLFAVTLLATVMSSLNSYAFLSAITIGNDILFQLIKKKNATYWVRVGLVVSTSIGILLAIIIPSAVQLIYKTASIAVPGLLIPIFIGYSSTNKLTQIQIIILMCSASALSLLWMFIPFIELFPQNILDILISVEPMIPGIVLSIVLYSIFAINYKLKRAV